MRLPAPTREPAHPQQAGKLRSDPSLCEILEPVLLLGRELLYLGQHAVKIPPGIIMPAYHHGRDFSRIANVAQGVVLQQNQVSDVTLLHDTKLVELGQKDDRVQRGRLQRLERAEAALYHQF